MKSDIIFLFLELMIDFDDPNLQPEAPLKTE